MRREARIRKDVYRAAELGHISTCEDSPRLELPSSPAETSTTMLFRRVVLVVLVGVGIAALLGLMIAG